ncbi:MAG: hypothetical protein ACRDA3_10555, partial [Peptostreptococcaceae bacterium]
ARVREIIINEIEPNEYDKLLIARLVQLGYVAIENQKVKIKVPFLVADEILKLDQILDSLHKNNIECLYEKFIQQTSNYINASIPEFISKDEKIYRMNNAYPHFTILSWIIDYGKLNPFQENVNKRIGTVLWMSK